MTATAVLDGRTGVVFFEHGAEVAHEPVHGGELRSKMDTSDALARFQPPGPAGRSDGMSFAQGRAVQAVGVSSQPSAFSTRCTG